MFMKIASSAKTFAAPFIHQDRSGDMPTAFKAPGDIYSVTPAGSLIVVSQIALTGDTSLSHFRDVCVHFTHFKNHCSFSLLTQLLPIFVFLMGLSIRRAR
jgi:hypothetical protein